MRHVDEDDFEIGIEPLHDVEDGGHVRHEVGDEAAGGTTVVDRGIHLADVVAADEDDHLLRRVLDLRLQIGEREVGVGVIGIVEHQVDHRKTRIIV
jgi:hypothetical protein